MAKLTLLEMTQDIANDLETDNVTSINDTIESLQIAQIIKTTYFEMMANRNWPHLKATIQFNTSGTAGTRPTHMQIPELTKEIVCINYNKRKSTDTKDRYEEVCYLDPEDFLHLLNKRNSSSDNVDTISEIGGIDLFIFNDRAPQYYTSFDDEYVAMDAYDSDVESSLQLSKSQIISYQSPTWTHSDAAIPDLPEEAFPALLSEAKSTAFIVLKQEANQKEESKAQRQQRWLSRKAWRVKGGIGYPNFGRRTYKGTYHRNPQFDKN